SELTLAEAAMIAGLVQAPSRYDPYKHARKDPANPQQLIVQGPPKERQLYVLDQLARNGYVTSEQAKATADEPLLLQPRKAEIKSPHWAMYIRDQLEEKYGPDVLYTGGLKVYTTLDYEYDQLMRAVML